ncbi:hypothetical protein [Nocardia cyriacigeorgica]|uniref:hypothetical protein n=1 Tax=Nocardia cyriacigeorgica TaxID=135487 RepID=UPI0024570BFB|nr:hypothetical protein [Nocardia cyriacigeorgica]
MSNQPESLIKVFQTKEVFVAGGIPSNTYNPRQNSHVEQEMDRFLEDSGKILNIYGASKSGKTCLVERKLSRDTCIWIQGQEINSLPDFWEKLGYRLSVEASKIKSRSTTEALQESGRFTGGIPRVFQAEVGSSDTSSYGTDEKEEYSTDFPSRVRDKLAQRRLPIVIDDFHYISDDCRVSIVRALKSIVRESPVILVAVPSSAFDVIAAESEMRGRVWTLEVPPWSLAELTEISDRGFELLNIEDPGGVAGQLAHSSYASPFIMQQLCLDLVRWENDIRETVNPKKTITLPDDFPDFLTRSAERSKWDILSRLLEGRKGSGRITLTLAGHEGTTDIYGAVLVALRDVGSGMAVSERAIFNKVKELCNEPIQGPQVTNALSGMSKIAAQESKGWDPVLRYVPADAYQDAKVFIEDSGFSFYLHHGNWSPIK